MLPATILSPSSERTFHEKFESVGLIRNTSPLYFHINVRVNHINKVTNVSKYKRVIRTIIIPQHIHRKYHYTAAPDGRYNHRASIRKPWISEEIWTVKTREATIIPAHYNRNLQKESVLRFKCKTEVGRQRESKI